MSSNTHEIETMFKASGVQDVVNSNEQIIKGLQELRDQGTQSGQAVNELSDSLRRNMEATYALRRGYSAIRIETRTAHMAMIEFGYTLNSVAGIGRTMNSMFQTYNTAQIRITEAQTQLTEADKDVAYWTGVHNQYLNDFGADSDYATKAAKQLNDALEAQKNAQTNITQAQKDTNAQYIAYALMLPGIANDLIKIGIHAKDASAVIAANGGLTATLAGSNIVSGLAGMGTALGATTAGGAVAAGATMAAVPALVAGAGYGYAKQHEQLTQAQQIQAYMQSLATGGDMQLPSWASQAQLQQAAGVYRQSLLDNAEQKLGGANISTPTGVLHVAGQQSITINQYNNITSMQQAQQAADSAYQTIIDKLNQQSLGK